MNKLERSEIMSNAEYNNVREDFRRQIMAEKAVRRVAVGSYLNFLFENRRTMQYQVQEMMRAERIEAEAAIEHEIQTYNMLIPGRDELSATLLIELDDPDARNFKLRELLGLEEHVHLLIANDHQVQARFDGAQIATDRLSSVQYLRWELGSEAADQVRSGASVSILTTHPACSFRQELSPEQAAALAEDLA